MKANFASIKLSLGGSRSPYRKNTSFCTHNCIYIGNPCRHTAILWKDFTLLRIKYNANMLALFTALIRPIFTRKAKIIDYSIDIFFIWSDYTKALVEELMFSFQYGNHRGFQPYVEEKGTNNRSFLWTLLLSTLPARNMWLEKTEISPIWIAVALLLLTIYFSSPLPDSMKEECQKNCASWGMGKKHQNVLHVEELVILYEPLLIYVKS